MALTPIRCVNRSENRLRDIPTSWASDSSVQGAPGSLCMADRAAPIWRSFMPAMIRLRLSLSTRLERRISMNTISDNRVTVAEAPSSPAIMRRVISRNTSSSQGSVDRSETRK